MNLETFEVGFNIPAKVGMDINEIQTPSLIIDYKTFENNILKMKEFVLNNNVKLRPHAKMHKSVDVAKYQIDNGGAHGICCQKLSEAEIFVRAGIKDILITNQITDAFKLERLAKIISKELKIGCCVDNEENIIRSMNRSTDPEKIENIVVLAKPNGELIRIKDIADVKLDFSEIPLKNYIDGKRGVSFIVKKTVNQWHL